MQKEYLTKNAGQTKKLGEALARMLFKSRSEDKAVVVALRGDLGGGKTTFLQGFAKGLGGRVKILSPTFIIMRRMKLDNCSIGQLDNFFHVDAYRLQGARDLLELGFREVVASPKNVVAIEWADIVRKIIPRHAVWVDFDFIDKNKRRIVVKFNNGR
ncbi:MAG: tRNA (adenosine(37)-N6)-threonylcarbamoyltransferase complex ATPase subunit type 1 TsaE [Candidatus Nealsonbacteria bacterium]